MKPLTPTELSDLKAKAKAATPGEWEAVTRDDPRGQPVPYYQSLICTVEHSPDKHLSIVAKNGHRISREEWEANNDYIGAANPETILRLIAMIERRDEQIEKLRTRLTNLVGNVQFGSYESTNQALHEASEALAATEKEPTR